MSETPLYQSDPESFIWPVKEVSLLSPHDADKVFPQVPPAGSRRGRTETLAQAATHYITATLYENGFYLRPVNDEPFGDACFKKLLTFSEETLFLLIGLGVNSHTEGDAVYEYDCASMIISVQAEEADLINVLMMGTCLAANNIFDSDEAIAWTLSLKLFDEQIKSIAGIPAMTAEQRLPYYEALFSATLALEDAIDTIHGDTDSEMFFEERYAPTITYPAMAPAHSGITTSPVLSDDKLVELVLRNVERSGEITRFIRERQVIDAKVIEAYLNEHPSAIATGSL